MQGRLDEARRVLERSWELDPSSATAILMISLSLGLDGDRDMMETWFTRAIEAGGHDREACVAKLEWLDPKWHGSPEEVVAFGRACRATEDWRSGIPLLVADGHIRAVRFAPDDVRVQHLHREDVYREIVQTYEHYLENFPFDNTERINYAVYTSMCGRPTIAERRFAALGDQLSGTDRFSLAEVTFSRDHAEKRAQVLRARDPSLVPNDAPPPGQAL